MAFFANKSAIVGIGQTEFSKDSGRSVLQLAAEASLAALDDAGLQPRDVDGLLTFTVDTTEDVDLMRTLGMTDLAYSARIGQGGGGSGGSVFHAAAAIASGAASTILIYRSLNERSGLRFGQAMAPSLAEDHNWQGTGFGSILQGLPYGVMTPAAHLGMGTLSYMREYGVTNEDFGHYAVAVRDYAATNPLAWFYGRPITLADHQASRWIVEPVLRLLDCCQESDGAVALVMTDAERARDLRQKPAIVSGGAQVVSPETKSGRLAETELMAPRLFGGAGLSPKDISAALIYDAFTPHVFVQLEALGFCGKGEAKDFIRTGEIRIGGKLPINMNGGLLGEAYIHGMNMITEGVRQIRGTASNQVPNAEHILMSSGSSGHILSRP